MSKAKHPIAAFLRDRRQRLQIFQSAVGGAMEVSTTTIADWESGRTAPNLPHLVEWARALGYEVILRKTTDQPPAWVIHRDTQKARDAALSGG